MKNSWKCCGLDAISNNGVVGQTHASISDTVDVQHEELHLDYNITVSELQQFAIV